MDARNRAIGPLGRIMNSVERIIERIERLIGSIELTFDGSDRTIDGVKRIIGRVERIIGRIELPLVPHDRIFVAIDGIIEADRPASQHFAAGLKACATVTHRAIA
jgi:hypothetical protein